VKMRLKDIISLIYIFVFIAAIAEMRFTLTDVYAWRILYHASILAINALCTIYLFLKRFNYLNSFVLLLFSIIIYPIIISVIQGLFIFPMLPSPVMLYFVPGFGL
jgi:hypothetical protein